MKNRMEVDEPYLVVKSNDRMSHPANESLVLYYAKYVLWAVLFLMILLCLIFRENLLKEVGSVGIVWLIAMFRVRAATKTVYKPTPFEIRFYDDYFIMYWEHYYYDPHLTRLQYCKFDYDKVTKILYMEAYHRMEIYGDEDTLWYDYNRDGTLKDKPNVDRLNKGVLMYFYTNMDNNIDFVQLFNEQLPVEVTVRKPFTLDIESK